MVLTFYKGIVINLWPTNIHLVDTHPLLHVAASQPHNGNRIFGALMSLVSALSYGSWLIIQAKMSLKYPSYYSSTALMCLMGAVQAVIFGLIVDHNWEHWKLGWNIRLLTVAYSGVIGSGLMVAFQAWCVRIKGPLYFQLILVALAGSLMLNEKLHLGSVLGAMLIVSGLYAVLWGKAKEMKMLNRLVPSLSFVDDPQADETRNCSEKIDADKDVEGQNAKNDINSTPPYSSVAIELGSLPKEIVVEDFQVEK